jgi:hypothetical protein
MNQNTCFGLPVCITACLEKNWATHQSFSSHSKDQANHSFPDISPELCTSTPAVRGLSLTPAHSQPRTHSNPRSSHSLHSANRRGGQGGEAPYFQQRDLGKPPFHIIPPKTPRNSAHSNKKFHSPFHNLQRLNRATPPLRPAPVLFPPLRQSEGRGREGRHLFSTSDLGTPHSTSFHPKTPAIPPIAPKNFMKKSNPAFTLERQYFLSKCRPKICRIF